MRTARRLFQLVVVAVCLLINAIPILIDTVRFYIHRKEIP